MRRLHRFRPHRLIHHHRNLDLTRTDHLNIYPRFRQSTKKLCRYSAVTSHSNSHNGKLGYSLPKDNLPRSARPTERL
jgi:hypothetical protein